MISPALTPIALASSPTVMTSAMRTTRLLARGVVISVFFCSLPGSARFLRGSFARRRSCSVSSWNSGLLMTLRFFFLRLAFLGFRAGGGSPPIVAPSALAGDVPPPRVAAGGAGSVFLRSMRPSTRGPRSGSTVVDGAGTSAGGTAAPGHPHRRCRRGFGRRRSGVAASARAPRRAPQAAAPATTRERQRTRTPPWPAAAARRALAKAVSWRRHRFDARRAAADDVGLDPSLDDCLALDTLDDAFVADGDRMASRPQRARPSPARPRRRSANSASACRGCPASPAWRPDPWDRRSIPSTSSCMRLRDHVYLTIADCAAAFSSCTNVSRCGLSTFRPQGTQPTTA